MCCGALAMAPVPDGLRLGLELGQPQVWPVRLRMGLALLWEGALAGKGAAWACLPEGAEEGELAEEGIQGGPAGRCPQQGRASPCGEEGSLWAVPDRADHQHVVLEARCLYRLHALSLCFNSCLFFLYSVAFKNSFYFSLYPAPFLHFFNSSL